MISRKPSYNCAIKDMVLRCNRVLKGLVRINVFINIFGKNKSDIMSDLPESKVGLSSYSLQKKCFRNLNKIRVSNDSTSYNT